MGSAGLVTAAWDGAHRGTCVSGGGGSVTSEGRAEARPWVKPRGVGDSSRRSFSSQHLSMASIAVVDTPGFHNPRNQRGERAATFEELCHNYVHERLQALFYEKTFVSELERYREVSRGGGERRPGEQLPGTRGWGCV